MDWACSECTFINPPSQKSNCLVCLTPPSSSSSLSLPSEPKWCCKACTFLNPYQNSKCGICGTRSSAALISTLEVDDDDHLGSSVGNVFMPLRHCKRKITVDDEDSDSDSDGGTKSVAKASKVPRKMDCVVDEPSPRSNLKMLKIMTYNVWFREDLELQNRMKALSDLIQLHSPHIICFQEVTPNIYEIFQQYSWWKLYKCSVSIDIALTRSYFCMQLSKLPVKSFSCKAFGNSIMGRELCIAELAVEKLPLVIATSHLESPCPGPPKWDQMYSKERVEQAKEALNFLKKNSNAMFCGDMNWDDKLDGQFPLPDGWVDVWTQFRPTENGWTYDTKSNRMLSGNRTLQKRLDRFLCNLSDFKIKGIEMIGMEEIAGISYIKEKKVKYLIAYPECGSGGFFNYIVFFYCNCEKLSFIGYVVLGIWLVALIYMLSNNAADYFCCSLEKMANLLKLPPTVAGVALLPLGNGAPDVFASIASFIGSDSGEVGLNSVLGGAIFVCCIVVGAVSIKVSDQRVRIDRTCFIRDVCFFLFVVVSLLIIIIIGEIGLIGSIAFVAIYLVYAIFVAATEFFRRPKGLKTPLLPVKEEEEARIVSLLHPVSDDDMAPHLEKQLPHWLWTSNFAIYSNVAVKEDHQKMLWGWNEEETPNVGDDSRSSFSCSKFCSKFFMYLELPLTIPRRLTIPIIEEDRWSKGYAVATATLAPTLLAFLWNTQDNISALNGGISYLIAAIIGLTLGTLAYIFTKIDKPPQKFLFPWVFGGFFMSIVWFYIIANELVAVLEALGIIFAINPSLLGLTVLAWGNSMGDLVSNLALASNGGDDVQIAMSGCYAGPIFNILAGLGIPMLLGSISKRPSSYVLPKDSSLYYTMGFLILGLVWSIVLLPRNKMQPNKMLGMGLITIYSVFLCCRASFAIGIWSTDS